MSNLSGWDIKDCNQGDGVEVARFKNDSGKLVYRVTSERDGYHAISEIRAIKSQFMSYKDALKLNTPEESEKEASEVMHSALIHACENFQSLYEKDRNEVLSQLV
jgi:hypothetical protein